MALAVRIGGEHLPFSGATCIVWARN